MRPRLTQLHQSGATSGQVPVWNNTTGQWEPGAGGGGGSGDVVGDPTGLKVTVDPTAPTSPTDGDLWVDTDQAAGTLNLDDLGDVGTAGVADGNVLTYDSGTSEWLPAAPAAGAAHVIEDEGTPLTARSKLNFVGAGVTVTDDSGDDASVVTISGSGGAPGAWSTYVPALTASTTNPTLGTGGAAEAVGRYEQIGKTVRFSVVIRFGTSGMSAGSGGYRVSLPVAARQVALGSISATVIEGGGYVQDDSAGVFHHVVPELLTTTTVHLIRDGAASVAHNLPFTFAASDSIRISGTYEAA